MIVLDAAALVDVVLAQPSAPWVLDQLEDQEICAPAHQTAEILSAIARLVRAGSLSAEVGASALAQARDLEQRFIVPTVEHLRQALVLQDRIRVLDALYVVLAQELSCPVVTTDHRLVRSSPPCEMLSPGASSG